ncbi:MAG: hypothetical protein QGH94_06735 [Phycisphaerae bacterium]|jgi:hypothetical protein|nr:hypothetical protein [Phycisphaerae bacterium]MDP7287671.1 hypothetical protein [Phycisphaerae bacterium]
MPDIPFWMRIAALVAVMAIAAGLDAWYRCARARRWKEYLFILLAGCVGAVFGALTDTITSSISPEYFIYGKRLSADGIRWRAMVLGLEAGFSAGVIAGALCLFLGRRRGAANIKLPRVATLMWRPFVLAVILGAAVPLTCFWFDPFGFFEKLSPPMGADPAAAFLRVWHIHLGVYLGLGAGVVWMIAKLRD